VYRAQRYEKVGQSESESDWSRDEKKGGEYSQDEGETDVELSQVGICDWMYPDSCATFFVVAGARKSVLVE